ncbi:MAG TPA: AEC family transporter [Alphaproteobacteria bacterium]|nr:AEC family transporter [Alphaproteobacteria bacterium]
MLAIVNVVIPVFAIIALGYLAVRFRLYPAEGVRGLVAFVNNFLTPCLLFESMLHADFRTAFNWHVIVPFYVGALVSFAAGSVVAARFFGNRPGESVASGFAAMFTNTVLLGIPILQRAYGEAALPVAFSIIAFHASVLITVGMLVMELVRRDGAPLLKALGVAAIRIISNPLLWGIVLGVLANLFDVVLVEPVEAFFAAMAAAVVPVALFGLGGALNEYRLADNWPQALAMSAFKLIGQPAIAWLLMVPVFHVDPEQARVGVVLAGMPAGINVYVFATYYNRGVNVATNTILISTVLSLVTVAGWLYVMGL